MQTQEKLEHVQVGDKLTMSNYKTGVEERVQVIKVWEFTFSVRDVRGACHEFSKCGRHNFLNYVEVSE